MELLVTAVAAALFGALVGAVLVRLSASASAAALATERTLLRERVGVLEAALADDAQTAAELAPLRDALGRVERQVGTLERDRAEQFGRIGGQLTSVATSTDALRAQTASLVGSLSASTVRGAWGEVQLRRVLEHSGMLARCDFEEQVAAVSHHDKAVRPDVVVHLPGDKCLVVDAKVPMTSFLDAQSDGIPAGERERLLALHARALRGHVDALAGKAYWTAFSTSPELVVCFVPSDAILGAAMGADASLFDHAMRSKVVLASPGTLLALLRTVAFTWQQDSLTTNARQLLDLGSQLYTRLGSVAGHATAMGKALQRSVESYNALIGSLESRVLVTARSMHALELADSPAAAVAPLEVSPRPLTAVELFEALEPQVERLQLSEAELGCSRPRGGTAVEHATRAGRRTA